MSKQWKELFLCQQSAAFQRELSALRRGFNRIKPHQQQCQEWIGRRWIIWFEDLVPQMIGIGEWRRPKEFPKGALKMVSSGTMCVLSSLLIDNSTHIHCAARVVDLNSLAQLIIIIILYSFLRYPWQKAIRDKNLTMSIILVSTKSRSCKLDT